MFNSSIRYKKNSHKELNFTQSKENMVVTQYNKCPTWIKKGCPERQPFLRKKGQF